MNFDYLITKRLMAIMVVCASCLCSSTAFGQITSNVMTLEKAIEIAKNHSAQAKVAQFSLLSQYWNYRSYKANMLPSVQLEGNLFKYDRSVVEDRVGSDIVYVDNNTLKNSVELAISQNIALTGGKISVGSDLTRLDQFDNDKKPLTYSSNPLSITYSQPLLAFNSLKWKKKTEPNKYASSKKTYLESMGNITVKTTTYYFNVLSTQSQHKRNLDNYEKMKNLHEIAKKRYALGTIDYSELLQLELATLNAEMNINTTRRTLESHIFTLCTYIGLLNQTDIELVAPTKTPSLILDYSDVLDRAYKNSSHALTQQLKKILAEQAVAQAKGARGLQADLDVSLGLSQNSTTLPTSYQDLKDREIIGLSLKLPIFDWGVAKGKVEMAKADLDVTLTEIEIAEQEFRQDIREKVIEFNHQQRQCEIAIIAQRISKENYDIAIKRFQNGTVSVTQLNNAQDDYEEAQTKYINQLKSYWSCYYEIQKLSLYDYINGVDITANFDRLVEVAK